MAQLYEFTLHNSVLEIRTVLLHALFGTMKATLTSIRNNSAMTARLLRQAQAYTLMPLSHLIPY